MQASQSFQNTVESLCYQDSSVASLDYLSLYQDLGIVLHFFPIQNDN